MINTGEFSIQNPEGFEIDFELLQEFENGLEFEDPESSSVPCQVLGYGEISTVFEILVAQMNGLAFKRVGIFETYDEMMDYLVTYEEYNRLLEEDVGLNLPAHGYAAFINKKSRPVFYIIQQKLSVPSIGNKAMHLIPEGENIVLFDCVLHELYKVWQFNQREADVDVGIDGQVSNWIIQDFDPAKPCIEQGARLSYVDTSTPMIRDSRRRTTRSGVVFAIGAPVAGLDLADPVPG